MRPSFSSAAIIRGAPWLTPRRVAQIGLGAAVFAAAALASATPVAAQSFSLDLGPTGGDGAGEGGGLSVRLISLFALITVLSLAPGIAMMITCFPFMVTTLSILRQAIGLQAAPPNMMMVSLALFLTYFVMEPVFSDAWAAGIQPMLDGALDPASAFTPTIEPFRIFMEQRVDQSALADLMSVAPGRGETEDGRPPLSVLAPAFMLSEIQRAFEIGFMIFLPFLMIDLVIASVLMAMGMMMVPPVVVSLPFKLAFFVMADGWTLLAGALVTGYAT
ncbi:MAG: flagellar type III secretion system pore protein FliP [Pseudomonadota bacterium]